jgi:DNA-binding Lrp family transcriptional regulator
MGGMTALKQKGGLMTMKTASSDLILRAPAIAMKAFEAELTKRFQKSDAAPTGAEAASLVSFQAYRLLLVLQELSAPDVTQKAYKALLKPYDLDSPATLAIFPNISQTVLFELVKRFDISRETVRRLLIVMSDHGLIERTSKGPPFPDQLTLSKAGAKLMGRVAKRTARDLAKDKPFGYL